LALAVAACGGKNGSSNKESVLARQDSVDAHGLQRMQSSKAETDIKFKELPKYPAVTRDIAMLVDKTVPVADIENVIKKASGKMLESLQLFDVYEGKQIPEGKKSVAYSAIYRSADRSLTGDEVQKVFDKVVKNLENQIGAQLR
jgi:phenylalanyl-tRNA synthetase beta subunit